MFEELLESGRALELLSRLLENRRGGEGGQVGEVERAVGGRVVELWQPAGRRSGAGVFKELLKSGKSGKLIVLLF